MSGQPSANQIHSKEHFHSADSTCLERIPAIHMGKHVEGQPVLTPVENWWRCTYLADLEKDAPWRGVYEAHVHGQAIVAHEPRARCEFPA